jgi:hypothetical protein
MNSNVLMAVILMIMACAIAPIVFILLKQEKQRKADLKAFASEHNWVFKDESDQSWASKWDFGLFTHEEDREVHLLLEGTYQKTKVAVYEHTYTTYSSRNPSTVFVEVLAIKCPLVAIPSISIAPEKFYTRMGDAVTGLDIDFEDEEFNRRVRVGCLDAKVANAVLSPRMMQAIKELDPPYLAFTDGWVVWYRRPAEEDNPGWHAETIFPTVDKVLKLLPLLPTTRTGPVEHPQT